MSTTFLSTGWALPTPERSGTSILLEERGALLDCGGDVAQKLLRAGHDLTDVRDVYLSHAHPDHADGLLGLVHANKFVDRAEPLTIRGPGHAVDRSRRLLELFEIETEYPLYLRDLEDDPGDSRYAEADHSIPAVSYRVGDVTYTGDTNPNEELTELARGTRLLVAEALAPDEESADRYGHMTPEQAGELAEESGADMLALVHTHPDADDHDLAERTGFRDVVIPNDLDRIEL